MAEPAQPIKDVDKIKSRNWAIYQHKSQAVIALVGGGLMAFELYNRDTNRAHTWVLDFLAAGVNVDVPYAEIIGMAAGEVSAADYSYFTSIRPVSFLDFDGAGGGLEYWDLLFLTLGKLDIIGEGFKAIGTVVSADFQASIPGVTAGFYKGYIYYGSGKSTGTPDPMIPGPDDWDPIIVGPEPTIVEWENRELDSPILTFEFPADLLFEFGHYRIKRLKKDPNREDPRTVQWILKIADIIVRRPQNKRVYIKGYTDNVGKKDKNKTLSNWRAKTVMERLQVLVSPKVTAERTWVPLGYGWEHNKVPNTSARNRAQNRRVEIQLLSEDATAPTPPPY